MKRAGAAGGAAAPSGPETAFRLRQSEGPRLYDLCKCDSVYNCAGVASRTPRTPVSPLMRNARVGARRLLRGPVQAGYVVLSYFEFPDGSLMLKFAV